MLSNIFREINRPLESGKDERKYILFDGDVDALWIENMNSVMDDNKILTLANQERIRLQNYCSLLFEVGDLQYASPATVSRAGMVYVDPKNLGYQPYMDRWINESRCKSEQELLRLLSDKYVHGAIKLILEGMMGMQQVPSLKMIVPQTALNMVVQLCLMFDGLYPSRPEDEPPTSEPGKVLNHEEELLLAEKMAERNDLLEAVYIQACYCSLGASLVVKSRSDFDEYMKKVSGLMLVEDTPEKLATVRKSHIRIKRPFN